MPTRVVPRGPATTSALSKVFLDTNLLVYTADQDAAAKRQRARDLLRAAVPVGVLSTQVLQEFYVVATRKLQLSPGLATSLVHGFRRFELITLTADLIEAAMDTSTVHQISFRDALIVVCVQGARCTELWTEDLNAGRILRGVRVVNPFAD